MKPKIHCPLCRATFGSTVGLRFHTRKEHPSLGKIEAVKVIEVVRVESRLEKVRDAEDRETRARRLLDAFYQKGCSCGRSYAWHKRQPDLTGAEAGPSAPAGPEAPA